jgi:hypothetical protein
MPKNQLDLCIGYTQEANSGNAELGVKISFAAGCVIVFEIFRQNCDCTFYVVVKSQRSIQKNVGVRLGFISFEKAFSCKVRQLSDLADEFDSCLTLQKAPPSGESCFRITNYMFIKLSKQ